MENEQTLSLANTAAYIYDGCVWFFQNLLFAIYNIGYAVSNPSLWLDWSEKKSQLTLGSLSIGTALWKFLGEFCAREKSCRNRWGGTAFTTF